MGIPAVKLEKKKDFPRLSKNYPVFRFMGGNLISFFGDQIYLIAIPLVVLAITGSPLSMGIVAALERLPILLQPITGILSDRFNRKRLLLICDFGRSVIVGLIGVLFIVVGQLEMWQLYSGALVIGMLSQIYNTSQFASVPNMVRRRDLHAVNSINTGIFNTAVLVAPGLGGIIISLYNPGYALLMNSFSFLLSFFAILSINFKISPFRSNKNTVINDIKEGFQFVINTKPILITNIAMLASTFGITLFLTMMIFHLKDTIQLTTNQIGWLLSIGGIGAICGALVTNFLRKQFSYQRILFLASFAGGTSIILFSFATTYEMLVLLNAMGTVAAAMMNPCIVTIRQTLTPDYLLGRVQATSRFMTGTLLPLAAFLAGITAGQFGTNFTILIGGVIACLASFVYLHISLSVVE